MLKRILLLILLLAVVGNVDSYMTDYTKKSRTYGPWQMTEHHIYWHVDAWVAPPDTTHLMCGGCDSAATTIITDTAFTQWIQLSKDADAYVCLFLLTDEDTFFNAENTETLVVDLEATNDINVTSPTIYRPKTFWGDSLTDTLTQKWYAHPDTFVVGSYIWGQYIRARVIRWIEVSAAYCTTACYGGVPTDRTEFELWIQALDTYP